MDVSPVAYAPAMNRLQSEMEAVIEQITTADADDLMRLIERLEKLDAGYAWLLDHVPRGTVI